MMTVTDALIFQLDSELQRGIPSTSESSSQAMPAIHTHPKLVRAYASSCVYGFQHKTSQGKE